jgi:TRAP transporter TAXI family solute receptor
MKRARPLFMAICAVLAAGLLHASAAAQAGGSLARNSGPAAADGHASDPAEVSDSLNAIFKLGGSDKAVKARLNANTVTVMSGTIGGTYVQFGADLASVLDDADNLRVLPIVGRGSVQSLADVLYLKGVDVGIARSDTLDYLERKGYTKNVKKQLAYITKLYNEEMHVVAAKSVHTLSDLKGKTVSVDLPNGGTFITAMTVFERLGIDAHFVFIEQRVAFEKLRKGEIDAMVAVQGKPSKFISQIKDPNLHLVPVDYAPALQSDYLPAQLNEKDYPALISGSEQVDTIAVAAILAVYNWEPGSERYRRLQLFTDKLFEHISDFQKPPFHPKWKEVVLSSPLPGWTRFPAAQRWLTSHSPAASAETRQKFGKFIDNHPGTVGAAQTDAQKAALFQQFLEWQASSSVSTNRRAHGFTTTLSPKTDPQSRAAESDVK